MTPLEESKLAFYQRRPWVMWWVDLGSKQQDIRFAHEEAARKSSRMHNMNDESSTWAQVVFDPEGERFPRNDWCCFLAAMCDTVTPKRRVKGS